MERLDPVMSSVEEPFVSTSEYQSTASSAPIRPARPAVLTAAIVTALTAGVFNAVSAIAIFTRGRESLEKIVVDEIGVSDVSGVSDILAAAVTEAESILSTRAWIGTATAVLTIALALIARNGRTPARVMLAVALLANLCGAGIQGIEAQYLPNLSLICIALASLASIVAIPLLFLPAVNRYAKR
jgi:hypothetical protein